VGEVRWLQVSLSVNGELAEAVADLLAGVVTGGVVVESGIHYNETEEEGTVFGPVKVYGYLTVDEHLEENRHKLEEGLWHLGQIQPLPQAEYHPIEDEDWMSSWKQHYHPIPIGKHLMILPAWIEQSDPNRVAVRIDPSMAFGTGTHPTTQLCLELLEKYLQPGQDVIDVGCGSGILSIAAIKLGAKHALAVDIDQASVVSTNENTANNKVIDQIETGLGSVKEIRQGQFSLRHAPVVMANILAPVILRLFDDGLAELPIQGGFLLLSGILVEQAPEIERRALQLGLVFQERRQMGDWVSLAFKK
jgi:ribosomal protein L11 methyltransferase